jgi:hypothetical protein
MISKPPTIGDVYEFDYLMSTPGVREGLMQRQMDGDPSLLVEETDDGPGLYYQTPYGEQFPLGRVQPPEMEEPSMDGMQLAAGPSRTMSDAGGGMPQIRPTPRNPVMGGVADFVRGVRDLANQYEIKNFVPLLGGMGVGDLLQIGRAHV